MSENNSYPNKEIFIHSINNEYSSNIKENSYSIITSDNFSIIRFIKKAYPSVNRGCLKYLLKNSLTKGSLKITVNHLLISIFHA